MFVGLFRVFHLFLSKTCGSIFYSLNLVFSVSDRLG
uniref:Uncharacterized protein n=1 Tax=Utricularia reniformis TaxID=192314 RepID=A0A1Y0B0X9_9LAMI|nr:hypothetical protein AEK19_MT0766 [Utricularia reniformis]ART31009.1 hypothetical protein AEK19_MT0766 [Utricularia reniformis]